MIYACHLIIPKCASHPTPTRRTLSVRRGEKPEEKPDTKDVESSTANSTGTTTAAPGHQDHDHSHIIFEDSFVKSLRGFLVVFALSIHELFEGFAVGLETSANSVWYMFGAVSAHKLIIAFCVGMELVSTGTKRVSEGVGA